MNSNSFAWRLIASDPAFQLRKLEFDEKHIIQLRGIFLHFDDDRDGLLTTSQLGDALEELGFSRRIKFLKKFCANSNQLKISGQHALSFKTDFKTFTSVISREIQNLQVVEGELQKLFEFVDSNETGYLSRKELRYLLVDIVSPCRLSQQEFTRFIRNLQFSADKDNISIEDLKHQILFQF